MRKTSGVAGVAVAVAASFGAGSAQASEFSINACQADRAEFSTRAFEQFANRGMMWRRACNPIGPGLRGLITANVTRAGKVQRGSRAYFVLNAPAGTHFTKLTWSGDARRDDCRYALQLWASRPNGSAVAIKNVRANRGCPDHGSGQTAGWPSGRTYDIDGATRIFQRVLCVASSAKPYCSAHSVNYIRTFKAKAVVIDTSPTGGRDQSGQPIHARRVGARDAAGGLRGAGQRGGESRARNGHRHPAW